MINHDGSSLPWIDVLKDDNQNEEKAVMVEGAKEADFRDHATKVTGTEPLD